MNRSIFQIRKFFLNKKMLLALIATIIIICSTYTTVNCVNIVSFKDYPQFILKEFTHNNILFYKTNIIIEYNSKIAIDLFLEQKLQDNLNYKISKYFLNKNGILIPFEKKSPYNHPNLFLGIYNNVSVNFQFSHKLVNNNFKFFSSEDITGNTKKQFLCDKIYLYNNNLSQIILNHNDLFYNQQYNNFNKNLINKNIENSLEIQNFIDLNKKELNDFINKSLKN